MVARGPGRLVAHIVVLVSPGLAQVWIHRSADLQRWRILAHRAGTTCEARHRGAKAIVVLPPGRRDGFRANSRRVHLPPEAAETAGNRLGSRRSVARGTAFVPAAADCYACVARC